jgi:lipid A 4'-phosphatase
MIVETVMAALGVHLRRHWMAWLLGSVLVFLLFPRVDLVVSGWFWDRAEGWVHGRDPILEFVRKGLPVVMVGVLLFLVLLWAAGKLLKERFLSLTGWDLFYLHASLIVGPGILVNAVFKDHWGRARPSQITEFGGGSVFSPPFLVSDQCAANCSFVSGHGALGFWVIAFAFLAPAAWRGRAIAAALLFGAAVGLVRIAQGGHFFSDVVYAGALTVAVTWVLWKTLVDTPHGPPRP